MFTRPACSVYLLSITFLLCSNRLALAQVNLDQGLIGCYPFNGNANDLSSSANHGRVQGATLVADRFGNPNASYDFDGANDFIEIGAQPLQLNTFSYSIWVKPHVLPNYGQAQFLFSVGSDYGDQHILFGDHYSNDRHTGFSHGSYLGVANNILCSESTLRPVNLWYHLVLIKTDTDYYLYINNQLVCSNSANGGRAFYGISLVRAIIGARNNYGQASNAAIDDIHLYNRAISTSEIDALYKGVSPTDPVAGTIVADRPKICAGDRVTFQLDPAPDNAKFSWAVDGIVKPGFQSNQFIVETSKGLNYNLRINAEVSFDISCFPKNPFFVTREFNVVDCTAPIKEDKQIFIPTIFTPNGDGVNDTWDIINASEHAGFKIRVYNKWGEVVFDSETGSLPWNGIYNGKLVPAAVYSFKIISDKKLAKDGSVTVTY